MPDTVLKAAPSMIEGRVDALQAGRIYGWAWDRANPDDRLEVELRIDGPDGVPLVLGRAAADRAREDLVGGGFGDGHHAFEADLDLPPGLDPARIVAVIRSPSTGAVHTLAQASAEEQLLERTLAPHLLRIAGGVDGARRDHQQIAAAQQGLARLLRDMSERVSADRAEAATAKQQKALAEAVEDIEERVAGLEVFLVRIDGAMRGLDEALKAKAASSGGPMIAAALGGAAGGLAATLIGLALFS